MRKLFSLEKNDAIIVVDVQNDFCPKGALPVPSGDQIVPVLNDYLKLFTKSNAKIYATRDWHPKNHVSFKEQGGLWPPHCIQLTDGAKFQPDLKLPNATLVISKGTDPCKESYSGFDGTNLAEELKTQGVPRVFVGGLATEYCVKDTVLDALKLGFETILLIDATRGLNIAPGDIEKAISEMALKGAEQAALTDFADDSDVPQEEELEPEKIDEKPITKAIVKKKARLRSRGSYGRIKAER